MTGYKTSKPLVNNLGVFHRAVHSPHLFSTYITDLSTSSICHLFKCAYSNDNVLSSSNKLSSNENFSVQVGLNSNTS